MYNCDENNLYNNVIVAYHIIIINLFIVCHEGDITVHHYVPSKAVFFAH